MLVVVLLIPAGVALAHHGPDNIYPTTNYTPFCTGSSSPGGAFCQTDNASLTYFSEASLSTAGKSSVNTAMFNQFEPTDLTTTLQNPPAYSGGGETDIIFQQSTAGLPASADGIAWCENSVTNTQCDQHYVRFRYVDPGTSLACHEAGHAVGLTHGNEANPRLSQTDSTLSCMKTPTGGTTTLGTHNYSMINGVY